MSCSTSTLPHLGVSIFPTPTPSGIPSHYNHSVDKLIGKWDGTGQGQVKGKGKDMGTFDKVPLTGGKSSNSRSPFASLNSKILSATFAPIPSTDISSSMEQLLMKTRGIVNKNKQQKHVAFYSVEYACMYNF
jgi:hypothetical protein